MMEISIGELYELFLDTIKICNNELLKKSDEEIECELFEEFDIGVHSFLHNDNLIKLRHAGYIDGKLFAMSQKVREQWLNMQNKSWTVEDIRSNKEWQELFNLCDIITALSAKRA